VETKRAFALDLTCGIDIRCEVSTLIPGAALAAYRGEFLGQECEACRSRDIPGKDQEERCAV